MNRHNRACEQVVGESACLMGYYAKKGDVAQATWFYEKARRAVQQSGDPSLRPTISVDNNERDGVYFLRWNDDLMPWAFACLTEAIDKYYEVVGEAYCCNEPPVEREQHGS